LIVSDSIAAITSGTAAAALDRAMAALTRAPSRRDRLRLGDCRLSVETSTRHCRASTLRRLLAFLYSWTFASALSASCLSLDMLSSRSLFALATARLSGPMLGDIGIDERIAILSAFAADEEE